MGGSNVFTRVIVSQKNNYEVIGRFPKISEISIAYEPLSWLEQILKVIGFG